MSTVSVLYNHKRCMLALHQKFSETITTSKRDECLHNTRTNRNFSSTIGTLLDINACTIPETRRTWQPPLELRKKWITSTYHWQIQCDNELYMKMMCSIWRNDLHDNKLYQRIYLIMQQLNHVCHGNDMRNCSSNIFDLDNNQQKVSD